MIDKRGSMVAILVSIVVVLAGTPVRAEAGVGVSGRERLLNILYANMNGRVVGGQHHKRAVGGVEVADWATHWSDYVEE